MFTKCLKNYLKVINYLQYFFCITSQKVQIKNTNINITKDIFIKQVFFLIGKNLPKGH